MEQVAPHEATILEREQQRLLETQCRGLERELLLASPEGFLVLDERGLIVFANDHLPTIFGYMSDELLGMPVETLLPERLRAVHKQHREGFVASPGARPIGTGLELSGRHRDGREFPVEIILSPLHAGSHLLVTAIVRDISERRRRETELSWRQNEFRALVDGLNDYAIFKLDTTGQVVSWNPGAERISGWAAAEIVGKHCSRLFPREDVAAGRPQYEIREAVSAGRYEAEGWLVRKDGTRFWANAVMTPLRSTTGELRGVANIIRDTSERKRIADERERLIAQLQIERTRLATILDQIPTAVVLAEAPSGRLLFGNRACEAIGERGFRLSERIEDYVSDFGLRRLDGRRIDNEDMALARAIHHGETVTGHEFAVPRKDGSWITLSGNATPLRDEGGTITGAVGVFADITEIRIAEESQRFLAQIGQAFASSIDLDLTLRKVVELALPSRADWAMLELVDDDLSIHRVAVGHVDPAKQHLVEQVERHPSGRAELFLVSKMIEIRAPELVSDVTDEWIRERTRDSGHADLLRKLGTHSVISVPLVARGALLAVFTKGVGGERRYSMADFKRAQEIAHLAAMAIDNAQLYAAAQRAIAERTELLATVSHDLRNPLTSILLNIDVAQRTAAEDAPTRHSIDSIGRCARTMQSLIDRLIDGARVESVGLSIEPVACDIAALVQEVIDQVSPIAGKHSIRIVSEVAPGLPPIGCDRAQLGRVLVNIIDNAVKFTGDGGQVTVSAELRGDRLHLTLTDTGVGISQGDLKHIFDRYWHRTGRTPSAGLGLYIAKRIVEAHGGTIGVESRVGVGTSFTIDIPVGGPTV